MGKEKIQNYQRKYSETNDETNRLLKLAIDLKESFALGNISKHYFLRLIFTKSIKLQVLSCPYKTQSSCPMKLLSFYKMLQICSKQI
jgi:hypothetical protein